MLRMMAKKIDDYFHSQKKMKSSLILIVIFELVQLIYSYN